MCPIDLHSHSTISDGLFSPSDLVKRAAAQGVKILALTDHDDVAGLAEARVAAREADIALINGAEISVTWRNRTVHVVGLGIDPSHPHLQIGLQGIRTGRGKRAENIAQELEKVGIENSLEGAYSYAGNPEIVSRSHFARFLVEKGYAKDVKTVFKKYLVKGKPGHVPHVWAELGEAVGWIRASGGIAVLAHPGRYDLGRTNMEMLLGDFKDTGGEAIEVVTGSHTPDQYALFAAYARQFGLLASCGSDYHGPGESYMELGRLQPLPAGCKPVWHDWPEALEF
jgi:predicted metal-dependent phosphoesterase TrpH